MANEKKVFSATDVASVVLYAKNDPASELAYPVTLGLFGMNLPAHDQMVIDESASPNVTITYKLDGTAVATKTIVVSGSTTAIRFITL